MHNRLDDATTFQFNIPENAFAVVSLRQLATLFGELGENVSANRALSLADEVDRGIRQFGMWEDNGGECPIRNIVLYSLF